MEQKTLSLVLKLVLAGFTFAGALLLFWLLPMIGRNLVASNPDLQPLYLPWTIFLWLTAVPCFISLLFGWSIATEIGRDNSFSIKNSLSLRNIAIAAAADAVFFFLGNILFLLLNISHPAVFLISCFIVFGGVAVAVAAACLSHLVYKAAKMREENDLTI